MEMDSDVLAAEAVNNTVSYIYQLTVNMVIVIESEAQVKAPLFCTGKHCSTDRADHGTRKP